MTLLCFFAYLFSDDIQGGDEELVADEREGVEHVDDADDVEGDGALFQLGLREQIGREQRVVSRPN